jgi:hypothetical protein
LNKKIPGQIPADNLFERVLSDANPNEFYLDICQYEGFAWACVIRREVLDEIVQDLSRNNFKILLVSLGVRPVQYLLPYINFARQSGLQSNNYLMRFGENNLLSDIETIPLSRETGRDRPEYSIGDQYVFSTGLLSFGSGMWLLAEGTHPDPGISNSTILKEREEYRYFKYYKAAGRTFLSGIFIILLLNFLLYNYYFNKTIEQQVSQLLYQGEALRSEKLRAAIQAKEGFIRQYGWDHPSRLSFFADRVAGLVPENTQLIAMKIYPVSTDLFENNGRLHFKLDTIQIAGSCEDPTELNRFVNNLRNIRDFKEVNIKSYLYKRETRTGIFLMEIIIN